MAPSPIGLEAQTAWPIIGRTFREQFHSVGPSMAVTETFERDGGERTTILWRNTDGTLTNWLGRNDGGFTDNWQAAVRTVPNNWDAIAIGDYNGDRKVRHSMAESRRHHHRLAGNIGRRFR